MPYIEKNSNLERNNFCNKVTDKGLDDSNQETFEDYLSSECENQENSSQQISEGKKVDCDFLSYFHQCFTEPKPNF